MQVEFCKSVDVESTVDVTVDDVTAMLHERMRHLEERYSEQNELDVARKRELLGFVNTVWQCFQAISNAMIADVEEKHRKTIADAFEKEVERWRVEVSST